MKHYHTDVLEISAYPLCCYLLQNSEWSGSLKFTVGPRILQGKNLHLFIHSRKCPEVTIFLLLSPQHNYMLHTFLHPTVDSNY